MKIRCGFVTNSSSSSYIICFARVSDRGKAENVIKENGLELYSADEIKAEMYWGTLGADWADVALYGTDEILDAHPDDKYVLIEGGFEIYESWDGESDYDVSYEEFNEAELIEQITEENGFADIEVAFGAGRNG